MADKLNFECPDCGHKILKMKKSVQSEVTFNAKEGKIMKLKQLGAKPITIIGSEPMECLKCGSKGKAREFYVPQLTEVKKNES